MLSLTSLLFQMKGKAAWVLSKTNSQHEHSNSVLCASAVFSSRLARELWISRNLKESECERERCVDSQSTCWNSNLSGEWCQLSNHGPAGNKHLRAIQCWSSSRNTGQPKGEWTEPELEISSQQYFKLCPLFLPLPDLFLSLWQCLMVIEEGCFCFLYLLSLPCVICTVWMKYSYTDLQKISSCNAILPHSVWAQSYDNNMVSQVQIGKNSHLASPKA